MVRKKKIGREEPDGLCSCLLTSCKSFLPSQSHTSFSLLLLRLAQCESVGETDLITIPGENCSKIFESVLLCYFFLEQEHEMFSILIAVSIVIIRAFILKLKTVSFGPKKKIDAALKPLIAIAT